MSDDPADCSSGDSADAAGSADLAEALARCEIQLSVDQVTALDRYRATLWQWNERLNLTRHTDFDAFVARDVVDSLQLAQLLDPQEEVLDVGSGGGVPGAVLAILRPDLDVTLSESVGKKAAALQQILQEAGVSAAVHAGRAEKLLDDFRYHSAVARAVGPLWKICRWFEPYWISLDRLLLIKGPGWVAERHEARERGSLKGLELRRVAEYRTPGTGARCVVLQLRRPGSPDA